MPIAPEKNELQHKNHLLSKKKGIAGLFDDLARSKMVFGTQGSISVFLKQEQAPGLLDWIKTGQVRTESVALYKVKHEHLPLCFSQLDF